MIQFQQKIRALNVTSAVCGFITHVLKSIGNERFLKSVYARWFCRACCEVKGKKSVK